MLTPTVDWTGFGVEPPVDKMVLIGCGGGVRKFNWEADMGNKLDFLPFFQNFRKFGDKNAIKC